MLDQNHQPLPAVQKDIETSTVVDLVAPNLLKSGYSKLQMYLYRAQATDLQDGAPPDQAQTFDRLYPGHNEANFWDFSFRAYQDPGSNGPVSRVRAPVADDIMLTAPYTDAITGKLIVHRLSSILSGLPTGGELLSIAGADITLDQLAGIVESVKVADSGFGFLTMSEWLCGRHQSCRRKDYWPALIERDRRPG